jgi:hypothetical protein
MRPTKKNNKRSLALLTLDYLQVAPMRKPNSIPFGSAHDVIRCHTGGQVETNKLGTGWSYGGPNGFQVSTCRFAPSFETLERIAKRLRLSIAEGFTFDQIVGRYCLKYVP